MKAIVIAGGKGTRLNPIISNLPKPIAPIKKRPFLEYLLDYWISQGIDEFVLSIGYMAEHVQLHFGSNYRGCAIQYVVESKPLGTGGAILLALDQLEDQEEPVIIVNGDTYSEIDCARLFKHHIEKNAEITIALLRVDANDRYSGVLLDSNDKLIGFEKRKENATNLLINIGAYCVNPGVLLSQGWDVGETLSLEDEMLPYLIGKKWALYGFESECKFIDIGIPEDYKKSQTFFDKIRVHC